MFQITTQSRQYLTYRLEDTNAQSCLEVVPERGGIITRWAVQGEELLFLNQERFANSQLSIRGGIPILFPICGNLPDNTYTLAEESYQLKQHGFARDLPWAVIEENTDNGAKLTLVLESNTETLKSYPFAFKLQFTYILQGDRLKIEQEIQNHATTVMPFSVGLHPYFAIPDKEQLAFEIPSRQYQDQKTKAMIPFDGQFDFSQDEIDGGFTELQQQETAFTDLSRSLTVNLKFSDCYPTLVFWTLKGQDYICLEPWTAGRNALNTGENLITLEAGQSFQAEVEFTAQKKS